MFYNKLLLTSKFQTTCCTIEWTWSFETFNIQVAFTLSVVKNLNPANNSKEVIQLAKKLVVEKNTQVSHNLTNSSFWSQSVTAWFFTIVIIVPLKCLLDKSDYN